MDPADAARMLQSLAYALARRDLLRWCVEHAGAGDPLPAAWSAATADTVMRAIAYRLDPARVRLACQTNCPAYRLAIDKRECRACADSIREVVPTLTLADVLASGAGAR